MTQTTTFPGYLVKRRLRRRRLVRGAAVGVLLIALGYAALPLWLPSGWLGRQIAAELTTAFGRPVHVGSVSLGWRQGVILNDLVVEDAPDAPDAALVRVGEIRCGFTPLRTLWTGQVDRLEVRAPRLWLRFDGEGRLVNLPEMAAGTLPAMSFLIRDAVCHVATPKLKQRFTLDHITCELDPRTGRLHLSAHDRVERPAPAEAGSDRARFALTADLVVPQLRRDQKFGGEASIEWTNLALSDLPAPLVMRLPVEQVAGVTTGRLVVEARPDLNVDYDLDVTLNGVQIAWPDRDLPAHIPDAAILCAGRVNPTSEELIVRDFAYETAAIRVSRPRGLPGPTMLIDQLGTAPFELHLEGEIKDWVGLERELPQVADLFRTAGIAFEGSAAFTCSVRPYGQEDRILFSLDALASHWRIVHEDRTWMDAGPGVPKRVVADLAYHRDGRRVRVPKLTLVLGDLEMTARTELALPVDPEGVTMDWAVRELPLSRSELVVRAQRVESGLALLPVLRDHLDGVVWRGPCVARVETVPEPNQDATWYQVALELPDAAEVVWPDRLDKPAGSAASFTASAVVPHALNGPIDELRLELRAGRGVLRMDPDRADIRYRLRELEPWLADEGAIGADVSWAFPLEGVALEELLVLFPGLHEPFTRSPGRRLTGDAQLRLDGRLSYRPHDWVLHHECELTANALHVEWDELLNKPAGEPLTARVEHRWREAGRHAEQSWHVHLRRPSGELSLSSVFDDSAEAGHHFEHGRLEARITDLPAWLAVSPALHEAAAAWSPRGAVSLDADVLMLDGDRHLSVAIHATDAGFRVPFGPVVNKLPGEPAELTMTWHGDMTRPDEIAWRLSAGRLRLDGLTVDELAGEVQLALLPGPAGTDDGAGWWEPDRIAWRGGGFEVAGELTLTPSLTNLHPRFRAWRERFGLSGGFRWSGRGSMDVEGDTATFALRTETDELNMVVDLDDPLLPRVRKPFGTSAMYVLEGSVAGWRESAAPTITLDEAGIEFEGNRATTRGTIRLSRADGALTVDEARFDTRVSLDQPGRLIELLPDVPLEGVEGACTFAVETRWTPSGLSAGPGHLRFDGWAVWFNDDEPVRLDGHVTWDEERVTTERVAFGWGPSQGTASGLVHRRPGTEPSRVGLVFARLDLDDLSTRIGQFARPTSPGPAPATTPATMPATQPASGEDRAPWVAALLAELRRRDIHVDLYTSTLEATLPPETSLVADALHMQALIEEGRLTFTFDGVAEGGLIEGTVTADLNVDDPIYHLMYTADQLQPGPLVDQYLATTFPGMQASGPLSIIDESYAKLFPAPGDPNFEVGQGELIIQGGTVVGRAAPLWLTRIFPGLNLASYTFNYMHSWFDKLPSGRIRHRMIFQGTFYNVYMDGFGDRDGHMRYEVGIDFLADFDSRYWVETGQGRIPLFIKTGVILDDGTIEDERVNFHPPWQILETLLIRHNPVITAYHAVRKQVLGEK